MNDNKRLYRSAHDRMIAGVCGGLAEYLEVDSTLIRLALAVAFFAGGVGLLVYIIAAIVIPMEPFPAGESVVQVEVVETTEEE